MIVEKDRSTLRGPVEIGQAALERGRARRVTGVDKPIRCAYGCG